MTGGVNRMKDLVDVVERVRKHYPELVPYLAPVATPAAALRAKADWLDETIAEVERRAAAGETPRAIRDGVLGREPADVVPGGHRRTVPPA